MKKIFSLLLALILTLGLCACQKETAPAPQQAQPAVFQVGYGRMDITPASLGLPMGGYGQTEKRKHDEVLDPLMVSAVAITGTNGETIILMSVDLINSSQHDAIRKRIESELGVPYDHIMLAATHTHSAPDQTNKACGAFLGTYHNRAVEAARLALEDRSPAEIYIGSTETERMNFVRHYLMNDGTYYGSNFGSAVSGYKEHAETGDHEMQVIKFVRAAEDKKDIVMVNSQGHPCFTGGVNELKMSADYIGSTRMQYEFQTGTHFIYFLGASGNQNTGSLITGESLTRDYQEYATYMCQYINKCLENAEKVDGSIVKTTQQTLMAEVNREMEDRLSDAVQVQALYQATDRATGNKLAQELGFSSVYHANGIINRSNIMEDELPIVLTTYAFGDVSFTASPYEMFADHSRYVKENTPYKMTFISTCTNGNNGYLPTEKAFAYGCYESHTSKYVGTTGRRCAETLVEMLNQMHG